MLLTIASATFAEDPRVRIVRADLRESAWVDAVPEPQVDAVLTATALHWLSEDVVRRLYGDLAGLVRPGGVLAHAEEMPLSDMPRLNSGLAETDRKRRVRSGGSGPDWDAWWAEAARDPLLRTAMAKRRIVFASNYPRQEFSPSAGWHMSALLEAGFVEVGVVWRSGMGAT